MSCLGTRLDLLTHGCQRYADYQQEQIKHAHHH